MTPETFWGCSVKEFVSSMDGYMITKGKICYLVATEDQNEVFGCETCEEEICDHKFCREYHET